jgi:site-specific recombinase XerD
MTSSSSLGVAEMASFRSDTTILMTPRTPSNAPLREHHGTSDNGTVSDTSVASVRELDGSDNSLSTITERTREYLSKSKAEATVRAYRADLKHFEGWCRERGLRHLPAAPETVADYISDLASSGLKPSTITRRLSAISQAHKMAGYESPTQRQVVRMTAAGIRRTHGTAPRQVRRLPQEDLMAMIAALPDDLRGLRDRALLLVGFVGGMRRSELVGLDVEDVVEEPEGLRVTIRRSKTDQEGHGRDVGLVRGRHRMTDVVTAVAEWKAAAGIEDGHLFRAVDRSGCVGVGRLSDRAVARIVKTAASRAGIDPATVSGHSLRGGFATSAAKAGAPERKIMRTTGHRSEAMVRRYIEAGDLFEESASGYLSLL